MYKEEIYGLLKLGIPLIILFFFIRNFSVLTRSLIISKLDSETKGVVNSIEIRKGIKETQVGGQIANLDCKIDYHYFIKNETYKKTEIILWKSIDLDQRMYIMSLSEGDSILVKFDSKKYSSSTVLLD